MRIMTSRAYNMQLLSRGYECNRDRVRHQRVAGGVGGDTLDHVVAGSADLIGGNPVVEATNYGINHGDSAGQGYTRATRRADLAGDSSAGQVDGRAAIILPGQ